ncbi:MAG TPA: amino acid ABC transporter substrate-binding protein [Gaiellaceae bacterium]|nr:amino acid ABC transporter substrate-binding protein [Gaiellaceae bacterium]
MSLIRTHGLRRRPRDTRMGRLAFVGYAVLVVIASLALAGCLHGGDDGQVNLLDEVKERGTLQCGVNDAVPGFGFVTAGGEFQGFDIDFCRAVAAGVLGDANAVEFQPLTAEQRFTALQAREIDVLIRNTTWTSSRDGSEGATFLATTFYDGQGMMVRADSNYQEVGDMGGTTICVLSGTTTELNLESVFRAQGIQYTPLSFEDNDTLQPAFTQGRCDGWTSDKSQLAGVRSNWPQGQGGPDALRILDETMSKEPLGPVVRDGDSNWAAAVDWIVLATIQAEEFGVTQANVEQMKLSDNPEIQRFLGQPVEGEAFDPGLGLDVDFAANVIAAVGNYGEIYDRNVGPDTGLGLERGMNALWTDGGLHYAPPYR